MPSGSVEVTAEEIWREGEEVGRVEEDQEEGEKKSLCGWNEEIIVNGLD